MQVSSFFLKMLLQGKYMILLKIGEGCTLFTDIFWHSSGVIPIIKLLRNNFYNAIQNLTFIIITI